MLVAFEKLVKIGLYPALVSVLAVACGAEVRAPDVPAKAVGPLADLAILGVFKVDDAATTGLIFSRRAQITSDLDLVFALGGKTWEQEIPYPEPRRLGLFLQDRDRPSRVYKLMTEDETSGEDMRVERATASDFVLSYIEEKPTEVSRREKFLFDVRAKALVGHFTYTPWFTGTAFSRGTRAFIPVTDHDRVLVVDFDPARDAMFKVLTGVEAEPWIKEVPIRDSQKEEEQEELEHRRKVLAGEDAQHGPVRISQEGPENGRVVSFGTDATGSTTFGTQASLRIVEGVTEIYGTEIHGVEEIGGDNPKRYPLPQSTPEELRAARPGQNEAGIVEDIGAWDVEADQLWIGKTFYDAEGGTGVGGFGWFDEATRSFRILSPPEVRDWSITALHADKDAVWMALAHQGEWGDTSGGVARYDRVTKEIRVLPLDDVGKQFVQVGDGLLLLSSTSMTVVTADSVRVFFVDRMSDGRLRVAEAVGASSFRWD
ncbi:MAG TPA: hypothetical protein VN634_12715 [Candidatus Limnocylindrales bacterium]|nr:hypothetical protein [Candidatus Limnocylindrales bacterium]